MIALWLLYESEDLALLAASPALTRTVPLRTPQSGPLFLPILVTDPNPDQRRNTARAGAGRLRGRFVRFS
jgi:hypothetical protein